MLHDRRRDGVDDAAADDEVVQTFPNGSGLPACISPVSSASCSTQLVEVTYDRVPP
jgi:hypothetical protein